jgi:hypothetical protein
MWREVTGDSFIVDIKNVYSVEKAAWYISKYIAKPIPGISDQAYADFIYRNQLSFSFYKNQLSVPDKLLNLITSTKLVHRFCSNCSCRYNSFLVVQAKQWELFGKECIWIDYGLP